VTLVFFALAFAMTPVLFLWTHDLTLLLIVTGINGFFTLGQYSWMPVWLPELFPTRLRPLASHSPSTRRASSPSSGRCSPGR